MASANRILNNRGVALLLVLGAISMLTIAVVEFSSDTDIQMELAMNERDRLRAEYLAYSASNLMQLELQLEKSAKGLLANAPAAMTQGLGGGPLCQKFPMSSSLLRGIFLGDSSASGEKKASSGPTINMFQQDAAKDFLSFVGDFDGQCTDLQSRINLNVFYDLDPAQQAIAATNAYDQAKLTIMALLQHPEYATTMAGTSSETIKNAVRNLADWVDKNDQINELGGAVGGPEMSLYGSDSINRVKNGKMLTMNEVFLVKDVTDDWFSELREMFTVYGDGKVNVCLSGDAVVMAVITRYATNTQRFATVDLKKPEMSTKLLAAVKLDCGVAQPQATKIAQDVDTILGGGTVAPQAGAASATPSSQTQQQSTSGTQTQGASTASNFAQLITTDIRWYELKSTGQVGDVVVHLTQVWDTKEADPKLWKLAFSKLE